MTPDNNCIDRVGLIALWERPADIQRFDEDYAAYHVPLARQLPALVDFRIVGLHSDRFHRMAELVFDTAEEMTGALSSDIGKALARDADRLQDEHEVKMLVMKAHITSRL